MARARSSKPIPPPLPALTRVGAVERMLVTGTRPSRVVEVIMELHAVSERQVWDDVKAVRDRWAKESEAERPKVRAELLAQVDDLYRQCREDNDHKIAIASLQLKADLHGLRVRPMAAITQPGAKKADVDAWLSGVLGFGGEAAASDDSSGDG